VGYFFWLATIAAGVGLICEVLAIPVYFRLRNRHRKLYRSLLFNPFNDVLWTTDLHELCSSADMKLVRLVRRYRIVQQYAALTFLAMLLIGAILEFVGVQ
jgi:hypothetical protein